MSKIGKKPIALPEGVSCTIEKGRILISGKKGEITNSLNRYVTVTCEDNKITVLPKNKSLEAKKFWGTIRANINNMVVGVSVGFKKSLEINGVGYKVALKGDTLVMNLGFSHEVIFPIPKDIIITCPDPTHINVEGIDKQLVGLIASKIKLKKKPEPYKGKGFKYVGEQILRKEGKKK